MQATRGQQAAEFSFTACISRPSFTSATSQNPRSDFGAPAIRPGRGMAVDSKVYFENAEKQRLVGLLRDTGSPETSILCHGFAGFDSAL